MSRKKKRVEIEVRYYVDEEDFLTAYEHEQYQYPPGWDFCPDPIIYFPGEKRMAHEPSISCWCQPDMVEDASEEKGYRLVHQVFNG